MESLRLEIAAAFEARKTLDLDKPTLVETATGTLDKLSGYSNFMSVFLGKLSKGIEHNIRLIKLRKKRKKPKRIDVIKYANFLKDKRIANQKKLLQ